MSNNTPSKFKLKDLRGKLELGLEKQERIAILVSEKAKAADISHLDNIVESLGHIISYKQYFDIKSWAAMKHDIGIIFDSVPKFTEVVIIMYSNGECSIAYKNIYRYMK